MGRTDFYIHIKFLYKKRVPGIICRKSQVEPVSAVTSDYRGIFSIAKASDMDIPVSGFLNKKLTCQREKGTKAKNYRSIFNRCF